MKGAWVKEREGKPADRIKQSNNDWGRTGRCGAVYISDAIGVALPENTKSISGRSAGAALPGPVFP